MLFKHKSLFILDYNPNQIRKQIMIFMEIWEPIVSDDVRYSNMFYDRQ